MMPIGYTIVKFVHVFLAIAAVGANLTYGVWFVRANQDPQFASFALRGIKFIDDRIANPAYILLLPTGVLMVWLGGYGFGTLWIAAAMSFWLVAMIVAYAGYTPTLKRQIAIVEREGIQGPLARHLAVRGRILAAVLAILIIVLLALMIFKHV
jgi:hypothetical protein